MAKYLSIKYIIYILCNNYLAQDCAGIYKEAEVIKYCFDFSVLLELPCYSDLS